MFRQTFEFNFRVHSIQFSSIPFDSIHLIIIGNYFHVKLCSMFILTPFCFTSISFAVWLYLIPKCQFYGKILYFDSFLLVSITFHLLSFEFFFCCCKRSYFKGNGIFILKLFIICKVFCCRNAPTYTFIKTVKKGLHFQYCLFDFDEWLLKYNANNAI